MSEPENTRDFRNGEIAVWWNQIGIDSYRNGTACLVESDLIFFEAMNDRTGEVDWGFGYAVQDSEGPWYAFPRELRKRLPPGPDWQTRCYIHPVEVRMGAPRLIQHIVGTPHPTVEADTAARGPLLE